MATNAEHEAFRATAEESIPIAGRYLRGEFLTGLEELHISRP
jgi:hypothetical protein